VSRPGRRFDLLRPEPDRWTGTITVGWKPDGRRDRITVRGRTKTEVKDKLRARHQELAAGVRTPANYTVEQCLKDWLETLNTQAESTVTGYRIMTRHLIELIGNVKLVELKVRTSTSCLASWPSGCRPGALGWPG
jgi:hypothetical protein